MALPEALKRALGSTNGNKAVPRVHITPIERAERPDQADDTWLSIEISEATATGLVLAVLRAADEPVKAKDVVDLVTSLNSKIPKGSINNIGTRLDGKQIRRREEGWSIIHPNNAPLYHGGFLWGPRSVFDKQELAAHRREAILHILGCFPSGLQIVQMVEQLRGCHWMQAPASKDLVKGDMEILEAYNKVRKISNSRKWERIENPT